MSDYPLLVAMTGASGAAYGLRLVEVLLRKGHRVDLLLSDPARQVLRQECGLSLQEQEEAIVDTLAGYFNFSAKDSSDEKKKANLRYFALQDWEASVASGSGGRRPMVICPCSMGTLSRVRHGISGNLIERAADVTIKEQGRLIVVPREAPLSVIHLENMLALARMGVILLPAAPGFYHQPRSVQDLVDFVVARILNSLGLAQDLLPAWPSTARIGAGLEGDSP